jgi:tRNA(Phe) wybutosine-synthesizing methylase Tyw3
MATDYSGTNTKRIDKLITDVVEIKTTLRMCSWVIGISVPFLVGLNVFLVARGYDNAAKLDRMQDRMERIEKAIDKLQEQSEKRKP